MNETCPSPKKRAGVPSWWLVGLATLALHGCVLDAVWPAVSTAEVGSRPLHVRTLMSLNVPTPPEPADRALQQPVAEQVRAAHSLRSPLSATRGGLRDVSAIVDRPPPATSTDFEQPAPLLMAAVSAAQVPTSGSASERAPGDPDPVPTYKTEPPPATHLAYDLHHGMLSGQGDIDWEPSGPRYTLKLEGRIASLTLLTQISTGGFDAHGLAPERYTDQRMKRAVNAANLQRGAGKITFSGPDTEYPLLPGTQDRVSWMVQLASVVNAQPEFAKPGAKVTLFVVGARGEGDVWVFVCTGDETVDTGMGPMPAYKFIREPTKPHDTQVEAWLAPRLHGLPAHARLSNGNDGALDLILREAK